LCEKTTPAGVITSNVSPFGNWGCEASMAAVTVCQGSGVGGVMDVCAATRRVKREVASSVRLNDFVEVMVRYRSLEMDLMERVYVANASQVYIPASAFMGSFSWVSVCQR